jgi:hypothetical protein
VYIQHHLLSCYANNWTIPYSAAAVDVPYYVFGIVALWFSIPLFPYSFLSTASSSFNSLSIVPYSIVSSLAISTRSSAYFRVRITCPHILKSPKPSEHPWQGIRFTVWLEPLESHKNCGISRQMKIFLLFKKTSSVLFHIVWLLKFISACKSVLRRITDS